MPGLIGVLGELGVLGAAGELGVIGAAGELGVIGPVVEPAAPACPPAMRFASCRCSWILYTACWAADLKSGSLALAAVALASNQ